MYDIAYSCAAFIMTAASVVLLHVIDMPPSYCISTLQGSVMLCNELKCFEANKWREPERH